MTSKYTMPENQDISQKKFIDHRPIFCGICKEETLWFPSLAFDCLTANEPVIVASCCECGETKKASVLNEYDRQMRYLHGGSNEQ